MIYLIFMQFLKDRLQGKFELFVRGNYCFILYKELRPKPESRGNFIVVIKVEKNVVFFYILNVAQGFLSFIQIVFVRIIVLVGRKVTEYEPSNLTLKRRKLMFSY